MMNRKTIIRFCGELANEFPELLSESKKLAQGDTLEIINSSVKIFTELSKVWGFVIEKNNSKVLSDNIEEIKQAKEESNEERIRRTETILLEEKNRQINNYKQSLEKEYSRYKQDYLNKTSGRITVNQTKEEVLMEINNRLRQILNDALDEKTELLKSRSLTKTSRRKVEECFRLLQREYNKLCKI